MSLPDSPIITKFFANKIESSKEDWPDYLLEIANVFGIFDGEEFDREQLLEQFRTLSDRSPYTLRDPANFRDEFGAYGPYLGVYHIENDKGKCKIVLSGAAREYLCSPEPDVMAFCRTQLSLFQYPNGAGVAYTIKQNGLHSVRVQANVLNDTIREVRNKLRLVPFRLICRAVLAKSEEDNINPYETLLEYKEIFALSNDNRTNTNPNPSYQDIVSVLKDVKNGQVPSWVSDKLSKFKRNFHIFEHTGLLSRQDKGLMLTKNSETLDMLKEIGQLTTYFSEFENRLLEPSLEESVASVVKSSKWGKYYDSTNLSAKVLSYLTDSFDIDLAGPTEYIPPSTITPAAFPAFRVYETSPAYNTKTLSEKTANPELTRVKREKANRDHARLVKRFASLAQIAGGEPKENLFVDLYVELNGVKYILEMKSCNYGNMISQIRKGISQLYEYRYRAGYPNAVLCLVLQCPPYEAWIKDYLVKDRGINVCWLIDDINIEYPLECQKDLKPFLP